MRFLRTNTATRITVGPFFDKTDGITPETGITVTSCKLTLTVDTAGVPTLVLDTAPTASGGSNDMVHITGDDAGFYDLELAAADVNYLGRALLAITDAAVHCPVFHEFMILPAMMYDSIVLGTDRLDTNVTHVADTSQTARDIGASVLLSSGTGTGQVKLSSGYVAPNWGDIGSPTTTVNLSGTTVKTATDIATDTTSILNRIGAFTGSGVNTILGFFKALFRSDASLPSDIAGTWSNATASMEAFYNNALTASDIADEVTGQVKLTKNVAFSNFPFELRNLDGTLADTVLAASVTCILQKDTGNFAAVSASPVAKTNGGNKTGTFRVDLSQSEMNFDSGTFIATASGVRPTVINIITQA